MARSLPTRAMTETFAKFRLRREIVGKVFKTTTDIKVVKKDMQAVFRDGLHLDLTQKECADIACRIRKAQTEDDAVKL
eukprot:2674432-Rhodomonas_salina.1